MVRAREDIGTKANEKAADSWDSRIIRGWQLWLSPSTDRHRAVALLHFYLHMVGEDNTEGSGTQRRIHGESPPGRLHFLVKRGSDDFVVGWEPWTATATITLLSANTDKNKIGKFY